MGGEEEQLIILIANIQQFVKFPLLYAKIKK
jgi:hypothetical protein